MAKENPLEKLSKEPMDLTPIVNKYFCPHGSYCTKLKNIDKAHCSLDFAEACGRVKRFYDQYGEAGNHLGVGS